MFLMAWVCAMLLVGKAESLLQTTKSAVRGSLSPLIPSQASEIEEPRAIQLLQKIRSASVKVPASIAPSQVVETAYARFDSSKKSSSSGWFGIGLGKQKKGPIVLLHGFDSSSCEYRRLAPLLAEAGDRDVIVPDLLGWGFTRPPEDIASFGPEAKMEHLRCFIQQVCGGSSQPVTVVGASLGGALGIILAAESPRLVDRLVLIDAQGFIDGKGPSDIPVPLARLGVNVLKSSPLRMFANLLAYRNKEFATVDAMRVGRLHCFTPSWEQASIDFLRSGGFSPSSFVGQVAQDTLLLWGRNDEILEPGTAQRFVETMSKCRLEMVEECGHVPHLEKPQLSANLILDFLQD